MESLESTEGRTLSPGGLRGKTFVIFYEDRSHTDDNQDLKEACGRMVARGLFDGRFDVLGVAEVEGLGFAPVQAIVKRAVQAIARRYGTELYLDFHGALKKRPWSLGGHGSAVAIVDEEGEVIYRGFGRLDAREVDRFFAHLHEALQGETVRAACA
ncbi:MAG: hypothetical protein AB7S26_35595 [Sandaracinaceae bacterium]